MQSRVRLEDVFLVQLIYFTRRRPGSEFRLYSPADSWISEGARHPDGLTKSLQKGEFVTLRKDVDKWKPQMLSTNISLDPESIAIARAVFWEVFPGELHFASQNSVIIPCDDVDQPSCPFWVIDLRGSKVISVSKTLDQARGDFEEKVKLLESALGRSI